VDLRPPARGLGDPRQNLQEGRLPGTVSADDADHFALFDFERLVPEGPDGFRPTVDRRRRDAPSPVATVAAEDGLDTVHQLIAQRVVTLLQRPDRVPLREALRPNHDVAHRATPSASFTACGSSGDTDPVTKPYSILIKSLVPPMKLVLLSVVTEGNLETSSININFFAMQLSNGGGRCRRACCMNLGAHGPQSTGVLVQSIGMNSI
jgi:hypothetical protein